MATGSQQVLEHLRQLVPLLEQATPTGMDVPSTAVLTADDEDAGAEAALELGG